MSPVWSTKSMSPRALRALTAFWVSSYQRCVSEITAKRMALFPAVEASMRAMFFALIPHSPSMRVSYGW